MEELAIHTPAVPYRERQPAAAQRRARVLRRRSPAVALLVACRPRQWAKNGLVAAAPAAAGLLGHPSTLVRVLGAFVAFCLISSATYLLNDVRDRHEDRVHPAKRRRPVAAGELAPAAAVRWAAALAVAGLLLAVAVRPLLGLVAAGYLAITISYALVWRRIPVADILAIAAGFLLRALAGGAAADVHVSPWFVIVVSLGAILIVAGKRHAELHHAAGRDAGLRRVMSAYSLGGLRVTIWAAGLAAIITYVLWALTHPEHAAVPWHRLSLIPFVAWLLRYVGLLAAGEGQAPEELVLGNPVLLTLGGAWLALFAASVYAGN